MTLFVWIWLGVAVLTLFVEAFTTEIVSIWFFVGSLVSLILAMCDVSETIQCWVFVGVSLVFLVAARPFLKKWVKRNEIKTNVETIVGKVATVVKDILPNERGEVKVDSILWSAIANEEIKEGQEVEILAIEGNKLIVRIKKEQKDNIIFESKGE